MDAGLVLPSNSYGSRCTAEDASGTYFIANCGLSGALESLGFLLPGIKSPGNRRTPPLETFDQTEFFTPGERNDMDNQGFLYVPKICRNTQTSRYSTKCHLHFYFHGCMASRQFVGMNHVLKSGFLEVAEANNIIVVFPQNVNATGNEIGCWDTYGFTGENFANQLGAQVQVVRKMLAKILGE